ncbi:velvet factor [Mycena galopus ATCC 62051]|nr:velvet factor [Mycena galopus ATCC 62051]
MRRQSELTIQQEPKQARMCGIGGKGASFPHLYYSMLTLATTQRTTAHRPARDRAAPRHQPRRVFLFLPPCLLLLLGRAPPPPAATAKAHRKTSTNADLDDPSYTNLTSYAQSFRQTTYYFMFASFTKPDGNTELHWRTDGRTRCTTGSVVSSLYALKDPIAPGATSPASDAGFFVFPDLSVRREGSYRLKLSLFEVVGDVRHCKSIYSTPFSVYTAKPVWRSPHMLPRWLGLKIRIRKDIRMGWAGRFLFLHR